MTAAPIPTVLIPGLACSARVWERVLDAVWSRGPALIADTLRDDSVEGIAARMLELAPPRFALVGISMGGYLNFEVLRQAPERVLGVAFLSTSARPDTSEQAEAREAQISAAEEGGFDAIVEAAFPLLVDSAHRGDGQLLAFWRSMAAAVGPERFIRQQRACIARPDSRRDLAAIDCPATVIHGAGDRLIGPENGAEIAAGITGAEHVVIPACGHMSSVEAPVAVAGAIGALLDSL